jgi:hypothetical protein
MTESKPLYELPLRDKPLGYSAGNVGSVIECPVCQAHGVRVSAKLVLHTVRYFRKGLDDSRLDETDACKLSAQLQRKHPRRQKVEQTEWTR